MMVDPGAIISYTPSRFSFDFLFPWNLRAIFSYTEHTERGIGRQRVDWRDQDLPSVLFFSPSMASFVALVIPFANECLLHNLICLVFSTGPIGEVGRVLVYPKKASIPKGVRLLADCAMSSFISLLTASQRKDAPSKSVLQFAWQNNNFAMSLTLRSEIKRVLDNRI